jgi:hypothetical protein
MDDSMDVVGHHDERVRGDGGELAVQFQPPRLDASPGFVPLHPTVDDLSKQAPAVLGADRDEVRPGTSVIEPATAGRFPAVPRLVGSMYRIHGQS